MVDNAFVTQGLYLGVEATRGVAVPATRRVIGFDLTSKIDATAQEFRPMGSKFVTVNALQEEWTSGSIGGAVCYTELPYLLSSVMSQSPRLCSRWMGRPRRARTSGCSTATRSTLTIP